MGESIETIVKRVRNKYKNAPKPLKIKIGQLLEGKIKLEISEKIKRDSASF